MSRIKILHFEIQQKTDKAYFLNEYTSRKYLDILKKKEKQNSVKITKQ